MIDTIPALAPLVGPAAIFFAVIGAAILSYILSHLL